jgi:hypothetical protein
MAVDGMLTAGCKQMAMLMSALQPTNGLLLL